jgi:hypothetical protein
MHTHFASPQLRTIIVKRYRGRVWGVLYILIAFALFGGLIALVPTYSMMLGRAQAADKELAALAETKSKNVDRITAELSLAQVYIKALPPAAPPLEVVLNDILTGRPQGITLNSIDVSTLAYGTSTSAEVHIAGLSATRETLVSYKRALETSVAVAKVDLPLSNLAKSQHLSFTMTILLKPKTR